MKKKDIPQSIFNDKPHRIINAEKLEWLLDVIEKRELKAYNNNHTHLNKADKSYQYKWRILLKEMRAYFNKPRRERWGYVYYTIDYKNKMVLIQQSPCLL